MQNRFNFNYVTETVKKALVFNGLFLALMSVFRLVFFIYFSSFSDFKGLWSYVARALILGVRYDLVIIAYLNTFVTLSLLAVWFLKSRKTFNRWLKGVEVYYILIYSLVFFILFVDFGFYSYFKDHINILVFGFFEDDTFALITTIAKNRALPVACAVLLAIIFLIVKTFRKMTVSVCDSIASANAVHSTWFKTAFFVSLVLLNGLAARGSLKMFPLGTMDAAISPNEFINKLSINGFFQFGEAIQARWNESRGNTDFVSLAGYGSDPQQAFSDFIGRPVKGTDLFSELKKTTRENSAARRIRPNVILIVMEGFGSDLLNYNTPQFDVLGRLKTHFDSDYVFRNFMPGDIGTIGSLESMFLNIPKRPDAKAITQSRYAYTAYSSAGALPFKKNGYESIFVYGGDIGWRNLQAFVRLQGFDVADGQGAMAPDTPKNEWGVYDEYLFNYIYAKLSSDNKPSDEGRPKFIMAMTTSNHPPYSVPDGYKVLPLKVTGLLDKRITGDRQLAIKRFTTYQYTNQKLGEMITKIKNSKYGGNTIIAVTGDHNFWDVFDYGTDRIFDRFSVPFYLYIPKQLRPARVDTSVYGSHIDILPTLYNLALPRTEYTAFGQNILDPEAVHLAVNSQQCIFSKYGAVSMSLQRNAVSYYSWNNKVSKEIVSAPETPETKKQADYYKALIAVADYYIKYFK